VASKILPADLTGRRALDVGSFDGFSAFELERRGADVVAIDVEDVGAVPLPTNNREAWSRGPRILRSISRAAPHRRLRRTQRTRDSPPPQRRPMGDAYYAISSRRSP
jgi:hypothetical protein